MSNLNGSIVGGRCEISHAEKCLQQYIHVTVCVIGGLLNVVNFSVFIRKQFNTATYIFMTALSFCDACTLFLRIPVGIVIYTKGNNLREFRFAVYYYSLYCEIPVTNITETVSVWLTLTLAIDRYIAMKYFGLYRARCTKPNARLLIVGVVFAAILLNLPTFFLARLERKWDNSTHTPYIKSRWTNFANSETYEAYSWLRATLVQFSPLIMLCVANTLLFVMVYRHRAKVSQRTSNRLSNEVESLATPLCNDRAVHSRRTAAQRKLTMLLIVIICLFLLGQIPQAFAYSKLFMVTLHHFCETWRCCFFQNFYRLLTQNICQITYASNFFVYICLNRLFREALCDAVICRNRVRTSLTLEENGTNCRTLKVGASPYRVRSTTPC